MTDDRIAALETQTARLEERMKTHEARTEAVFERVLKEMAARDYRLLLGIAVIVGLALAALKLL